MMENVLIEHLSRLIAAYVAETGSARSTVSKAAAGDWRFFGRLGTGPSFTVRVYDRVVGWFADHWPEDLDWPSDIPRPVAPEAGPAGSAPGSTPTREPAEISEGAAEGDAA